MGAFAWGHPFLDGNGRTMLLVHAELCHRTNISINWSATHKHDYLQALAQELQSPQSGHLDAYLRPFVTTAEPNSTLLEHLLALPGLDGRENSNDINMSYAADDPKANQAYREIKRSRGVAR